MTLAPETILAHYDAHIVQPPRPLGNAGGFSGARLWRVASDLGDLCLRAWPTDMTPARLSALHRLMYQARQAGLAFVPAILPTRMGTMVEARNCLWELSTWMPGRADYRQRPSHARLEAACTALAHLHQAWRLNVDVCKPCPGWLRRVAKVRDWLAASIPPPHLKAADQAWQMRHRLGPWLQRELLARDVPSVPTQPCLCDPWHDHVLFTGDEVTGLIDYGSVKEDHVAVDLARLLGSLVEDDEEGWSVGLGAYQRIRPLTQEDIELARRLDRTGVACAAATWLRWLCVEKRHYENHAAIAERLMGLVRRMERFNV